MSLKNSVPFNQGLERIRHARQASEVLPMPAHKELEITIHADGTVESAWWTPEIGLLLCGICGMQGSTNCIACMNSNPYCG
ncbi:hypothetical protein Psch_03525 [Pelotomaculum schinkii]|uniref:Uncharacterized protein n=1 Tax=Pelotomaculum schinkii TaxID=78350 RepID=A0A4Y7R7U5_9FIRM|nr:hypothetical protein [Pelotomaculum schinkii]TEB04763.1 hypothetical protein Psch_03525 [Pelotomaculum schinkii]